MKRSVRMGVFETNSSSTHSISICSEDQYEKLRDGRLFINLYTDEIITPEEGLERVKQDGYELKQMTRSTSKTALADALYALNFVGFSAYIHRLDDHVIEEHFTTPSGDKVVVFGCCGYD